MATVLMDAHLFRLIVPIRFIFDLRLIEDLLVYCCFLVIIITDQVRA